MKAATILNVAPDHLDRHGTMQAYQTAKHRIYHHAEMAVLNRSDKITWPSKVQSSIYFGTDKPQRSCDFGIVDGNFMQGDVCISPVSEAVLLGHHNQENIIAAMALASVMGVPHEAMATVIRRFTGSSTSLSGCLCP